MAAFDPATIQLLRDLLAKTNAQHKRDLGRLAKFKSDSKDSRAEALRERVGVAVRVARDLDRLIPFMEGLNSEEPGEIDAACCVAAEQLVHDEDCEMRTAAEVLSSTPLAVAFGSAPAAEDGAS